MVLDHRGSLVGFRSHLSSFLVYPLQFIVDLPFRMLNWSTENLAARKTLLIENQTLKNENLLLHSRLQILDGIEKENERLRALLKSSREIVQDPLVAELLTISQDPYKQQILLNKGKAHHVYPGQPVIDAKGVMGQIIDISVYSSTAILISDPNHTLPVQINRSGLRTIAQGTGNPNELELRHIPNNADITAGDLIVTSGLGGRFPANYPVAYISSIEISPGKPFAKVKATPTALLDTSREVLLIWPPGKQSAH